MTMTTAETGVETTHHHEATGKDATLAVSLFALFIVLVVVAAVAFYGLGGLILCGVGATWAMLAFLVVMTAGG